MLFALSGLQGRQDTASAHSCGAVTGVLLVGAHPASTCSWQGLRRLWGGLCFSGVGLVEAGDGVPLTFRDLVGAVLILAGMAVLMDKAI